jgi:hypothetical protein
VDKDCSYETLQQAIEEYQREHELDDDGLVGPATIRRVYSDREASTVINTPEGFLLVDGKIISVPFRARMCGPTSEYDLTEEGDYNNRKFPPTQVVWHWDACLNAKTCHRILSKKGISSHGCIDNDGTFYQFLDFGKHAGWHAGHRLVNRASIGIDISNAVYTKYQGWYKRKFSPRPILRDVVTNGRKHKPFLGYYEAQIDTARELALFFNKYFGITLATPEDSFAIKDPEKFSGHIAHYHVTSRKWDVAGFPLEYVAGKAIGECNE